VLPAVFEDGLGGVVLFHGEAAAVFRVAHPASSHIRGATPWQAPSSLRYAVASSVFS
jgi:hypothetical protein